MIFRSLTMIFVIAALASSAFAAASDLIIPVTGTVAGANDSAWQGELTLHNASNETAVITVTFFPSNGAPDSDVITIAPRSTVTYANAVMDLFEVETGSGALVLEIPENAKGQIAVTSRILNLSEGGVFGQDVPAIPAIATLRAGSTAAIPGPAHVDDTRFNFGLFNLQDSEIAWRLLSADGTVMAEKTISYEAHEQVQYNEGIASFFEAVATDGMTVHARVLSGEIVAYGSIVAATTGDPTWVPGIEIREGFAVEFAGVDLDENGTVDVFDADGDGVLDQPVTVFAGAFPNYFRVVVNPTNAGVPTLTLVEAPSEFVLIDSTGTIQVAASAVDRGNTYQLVVRATDGFSTSDFVIPVIYR